jgi:hypothetical protein
MDIKGEVCIKNKIYLRKENNKMNINIMLSMIGLRKQNMRFKPTNFDTPALLFKHYQTNMMLELLDYFT